MEVVEQLKVKPTDGEMSLLKILQLILDDSYEVFFNRFKWRTSRYCSAAKTMVP